MRATATAAALLSLASVAVSQSQTIKIQVGAEAATEGGIFQFIPSNITAPVGSTVVFTWQGSPGNHSVTQMAASKPCEPLAGGFDSGFLFIPANTTSNFPTWNVTITDSSPLYFYCAQLAPSPHCIAGMVGSINAPTTGNDSWEAVWEAAMAVTASPPQPTAGAPLQAVNASVTAPPGPVGTATNGIQGFDLPGTASGGSSSGSSAGSSTSGSSTSSGSAAPTTTNSGALANAAVSGVALLVSAVFGTLLL